MQPAVSVVIPAYNEQEFIGDCLSTMRSLCGDARVPVEIIVVDNGSDDATATISRPMADTVLTIKRTTVGAARNAGAAIARAPVLAFIDADVRITRQWIETFQSLSSRQASHCLLTGYQYAVRDDANWLEDSWFRRLKDKLLNGGNILISRPAFERIGGFDPRLKTGEDYELCRRAIAAGVEYAPDAGFRAIHLGYPRTINDFFRRECWHGEGSFGSLRRFIGSPVAVIAVGYLLLQVGAIVLLPFNALISLMLIGVLLATNLALTLMRFPARDGLSFLYNNFAHYLYFTARGFSLFRAIRNRAKAY
jgi:glycosyltransferase involved in cell wall biosynthesis